jgi:DNA-binding MarR family transcriptional regulator
MTTSSENYRLENSLGFLLLSACRTHSKRLEELLQEAGITRVEFKVLVAIGAEGRSQPSEIADFLDIDKPAVSRALRSLEDAGLIVTGKTQTDRRATILGLTPRGRQAMNKGIEGAVEANDALVRVFSAEERSMFADLLARTHGRPGRRH